MRVQGAFLLGQVPVCSATVADVCVCICLYIISQKEGSPCVFVCHVGDSDVMR